MVGIYFWNPHWLLPDLRFEFRETRFKYEDELNRLKSKVDLTNGILKSEFKNISNKASAKLELSNDCAEPFIFSYQKTMIDALSQDEQARLRRIANNLKVLQNECKLIIFMYNSTDINLNSARAKNIHTYLIKEGVPQVSVSISNEIEKHILLGVRLKLML